MPKILSTLTLSLILLSVCNAAEDKTEQKKSAFTYRTLIKSIKYTNGEFTYTKENGKYSTAFEKPTTEPKRLESVLSYTDKLQQVPQEEKRRLGIQEKVLKRIKKGKDGRKKIDDTFEWPHRLYCHLNLSYRDGDYQGSGILVGPHHILTCAHNVFESDTKTWVKEIKAYFALNGETAPFKPINAARVFAHPKYLVDGNREYDIALIVLTESIGEKIGWSGIARIPANKLINAKIAITGYPGDKADGTELWGMAHTIKEIDNRRIFYEIDTAPGQSGSPICLDESDPCVVGVHTLGEGKYAEGNSGVRLTTQKFKRIIDVISETKKIQK